MLVCLGEKQSSRFKRTCLRFLNCTSAFLHKTYSRLPVICNLIQRAAILDGGGRDRDEAGRGHIDVWGETDAGSATLLPTAGEYPLLLFPLLYLCLKQVLQKGIISFQCSLAPKSN